MKTPWFYGYCKLLKIQKAIRQSNEKKRSIRFCRNYQRLLYRNSFIQLLIINEILKDNLLETNFGSKKYRQFFKRDIVVRLWIFALSPILDNQRSLTYFESNKIYETFRRYLKKSFVQYVLFCKFSNFFSKKNKYWIISNISVEKKFFLNEIFKKKKSKKLFLLKKIFKQLVIFHFKVNLKTFKQFPVSKSFYYSAKKKLYLSNSVPVEIFEYNTIALFFLKKEFQGLYLDPKIYGLNFQFVKFSCLKNGIYFLGWFFKKSANHLKARASYKNLFSYRKEIKKCFNKNQPIDKIIANFNRKIINWRKIYRNDYFFYQIWYWMKKRHKKKNIKWLYNYYWNQSISEKWIFSVNDKIVIFSQK